MNKQNVTESLDDDGFESSASGPGARSVQRQHGETSRIDYLTMRP